MLPPRLFLIDDHIMPLLRPIGHLGELAGEKIGANSKSDLIQSTFQMSSSKWLISSQSHPSKARRRGIGGCCFQEDEEDGIPSF